MVQEHLLVEEGQFRRRTPTCRSLRKAASPAGDVENREVRRVAVGPHQAVDAPGLGDRSTLPLWIARRIPYKEYLPANLESP